LTETIYSSIMPRYQFPEFIQDKRLTEQKRMWGLPPHCCWRTPWWKIWACLISPRPSAPHALMNL